MQNQIRLRYAVVQPTLQELKMVGWMRGLVNGLQNRLHPFESGTDLIGKHDYSSIFPHGDMLFFIFPRNAILLRT